MSITRRNFVKGCAAAGVLLLPGFSSAARNWGVDGALVPVAARIEKSIKAGFGGGFSVLSHTQSNGLVYADIQHLGARYEVASADLLDWKIVHSS